MLCKKIASQDVYDRIDQGLDRLLAHINKIDEIVNGRPYTTDMSLRKLMAPQIKAAEQAQAASAEKIAIENKQLFKAQVMIEGLPLQQQARFTSKSLNTYLESKERVFWEKEFSDQKLWEKVNEKLLMHVLAQFLETYGVDLQQLNMMTEFCREEHYDLKALLGLMNDYMAQHNHTCHDLSTEYIQDNIQMYHEVGLDEFDNAEPITEVEEFIEIDLNFGNLEEVKDPNFPY